MDCDFRFDFKHDNSLSNTGDGSGDGEISAAVLLKMPMEAFEVWCAKNPAKAKRIVGGWVRRRFAKRGRKL